MSRLVNDLSLLAMSERPDFLRADSVDLREVGFEAYQKVTALGVRDWRLDAPHSVIVVADRQRITQAIVQLAANAVKFTRDHDAIRVGTTDGGSTAAIWVEVRACRPATPSTFSGASPGPALTTTRRVVPALAWPSSRRSPKRTEGWRR